MSGSLLFSSIFASKQSFVLQLFILGSGEKGHFKDCGQSYFGKKQERKGIRGLNEKRDSSCTCRCPFFALSFKAESLES